MLERRVAKVKGHLGVLEHHGGEELLAAALPPDGEGQSEVPSVLRVRDLVVVQVEVAPDHVGLSERLAVVVELAVVGLLPGPSESESVRTRAQVVIGFRRGEPHPAQPLVLHHGLVVPPSPAGDALGRPASVPLLLVSALAAEAVRGHREVLAPVVHGHRPAGGGRLRRRLLTPCRLLSLLQRL